MWACAVQRTFDSCLLVLCSYQVTNRCLSHPRSHRLHAIIKSVGKYISKNILNSKIFNSKKWKKRTVFTLNIAWLSAKYKYILKKCIDLKKTIRLPKLLQVEPSKAKNKNQIESNEKWVFVCVCVCCGGGHSVNGSIQNRISMCLCCYGLPIISSLSTSSTGVIFVSASTGFGNVSILSASIWASSIGDSPSSPKTYLFFLFFDSNKNTWIPFSNAFHNYFLSFP